MTSPPHSEGNQEKQTKKEIAGRLDFLATVSHEIRNPLNVIIGISRLLKGPISVDEREEYIDSLLQTSEGLLELVNNIMDYSKLGSPNLQFTEKPADLRKMVDRNLSGHAPLALSKGLDLRSEISADLPSMVITDAVKLSQVIWNLISNALKFTEKGAVTVCVGVEEQTEGNIVVKFSVKDTGIGIPQEKMQSIFEAFNQGSDETCLNYGGSGLGLSISQSIVEAMGGQLMVESREGLGSEFSFVLRFKVRQETSQEAPDQENLTLTSLGRQLRVLIVDDNRLNLLVVQKHLEQWDVDYDTAADGVEALDKVRKQDFDLVLMDCHMPGMNGLQATAEIRKMHNMKDSNLPVIALTASAEIFKQGSIHSAGFTDVLNKPFTPKDLLDKIITNAAFRNHDGERVASEL